MVKGTMKWIPKEVLEELESIKLKFDIDSDSDAFRKIVQNSKIGNEIRMTIGYNLRRKK